MLPDPTQQSLFELARAAIHAHLQAQAPPPLPPDPHTSAPRGVFVTLRRRGELRGCIGHASARLPLAEAVRELAVAAAFHDRRFEPVTADEVAELELELTVLSEPEPAQREQIEVGLHGLLVRRGTRSGLLLPQVAVEQAWDRETFLRATCRKAGLPPEAWRDPETHVLWFTGQAYSETRQAN